MASFRPLAWMMARNEEIPTNADSAEAGREHPSRVKTFAWIAIRTPPGSRRAFARPVRLDLAGITMPTISVKTLLRLLPFVIFTAWIANAEPLRNVVVLLVDDLGVTDINPGEEELFYETPNLRKFAKSGVSFSEGYASCPVCSPTRSALMTGRNPARTHNTDYFGAVNKFLGKIPAEYDPVRDFLGKKKVWGKRGAYPVLPAPYLGNLSPGHVTVA